MRIVIDIPDELSCEAALAVLNDCVDHAAATSICTGRMTRGQQDDYLAVAYHLRKAIRSAQKGSGGAVIDGSLTGAAAVTCG